MITTLEFANAVGRKKMAKALEVLTTAVSNAVVRGSFPPSWLKTCEGLAKEAGIDCPPELFNQRPFHNPQAVNASAAVQGPAPKTQSRIAS